jgi:hypothetical protein
LDAVFPTGGCRGSTLELEIRGRGLSEPRQVLLGGTGLTVERIDAISDTQARVRLVVGADAPLGPRRLRLATGSGLSDPAWFVVGSMPEVAEREPNEDRLHATEVTLPAVVSGVFGAAEDLDCYRFQGRRGQNCVAAIEAFRYDSQVLAGNRWQFSVPVFEVDGPTGQHLAAAVEGREWEPAVAFSLPEDGEYLVRVHELGYLGGARGIYRLTLGDVPYPRAVFPAGVRRGEQEWVQPVGLNLPPPSVALSTNRESSPGFWIPYPQSGKALPLLTSELPECREQEPNGPPGAQLRLPMLVNGKIDAPGDEDCFSVSLRAGEGIRAEAFAGRILGSAVDLELAVLDAAGRRLAENDDDPGTLEETRNENSSLSGDPRIEFTAPGDGIYTLRVRDLAQGGGPACLYRLSVEPLRPDFSLSTRYDNPSVPGSGGTAGLYVSLRRTGGFAGPVRVGAKGLPSGWVAGEALFAAGAPGGTETAIVTITAPRDSQPGQVAPFRLEGTAEIAGAEVIRPVRPTTPVGDNYRTIPFFRATDGCVACIVAPREGALTTSVRELRARPGETVQVPIQLDGTIGAGGTLTLSAQRGHRQAWGAPVTLPSQPGPHLFPLRVPGTLAPGVYSWVAAPPPAGDFRWHRLDRCTLSMRLIVEGERERSEDRKPAPDADRPPGAEASPEPPAPDASRRLVPGAPRARRSPDAVSFVNDLLPALTRAGCNQGACHGAGSGRGGLRLSLWGFDAAADYEALVREAGGRRINRAFPADSLVLRKPTLAVPHGGGLRLAGGDAAYAVIIRWLAQGAPGPDVTEPRLQSLAITQPDCLLRPKGRVAIRLRARFDDGTAREVASWSRLTSSQPGVATVTPDGVVTAHGPGEAVLTARYQSQVTTLRVAVPFTEPLSAPAPTSDQESAVDRYVQQRLGRLGLADSGPCSEEEFLRRVALDLIGTLPNRDEQNEFLTQATDERRRNGGQPAVKARLRWIDRLLERPEWVDYWALYLGDLFRNNREVVGDNPMWAFRAWLRESLRRDRPFPELVREMIATPGSVRRRPALAYYYSAKTPEELAETTSQVLLGVRLQCARCHDHPSERWTQRDYYAFAACFARVRPKGSPNLGKFGGDPLLLNAEQGEIRHPKVGEVMAPRALGAGSAFGTGADRTERLAEWLAAPVNPFVARTLVNRVWGRLMGRGLVDPVDDFRTSNPPSHPELLAELTRRFAAGGFRLRPLMRYILTSRAYQRSSRVLPGNRSDDRYYSRYFVRRLPAEPLLDALGTVAGVPPRFGGVPVGTRAIALPDNLHGSQFLDLFGRPARLSVCECERDPDPNLAQTLHLLNGDLVHDLLTAPQGRAVRMAAEGTGIGAAVEEFYRVAFCRPPRPRERAAALSLLAEAPSRREGLEDLLWTLLNSREFLLNH